MILTFFLIIVPILLIWDHLYRKKKNDIASNIPGPPAYPIIGNLFNFQQRNMDDAVEFMKSFIAQYGGLVRTWTLNKMIVLVAEPKALEVLLTSPKYLKKSTIYNYFHAWIGNGLLVSTGRKWFQRRKIITPTFHFKILEDFVKVFDEQSTILIDHLNKLCDKGAFDVNPYITRFALGAITETAFGIKINVQNDPDCEYARAVHTMSGILMLRVVKPHLQSDLLMKYLSPKLQKKQDNAVKVLHSFTQSIIKERRKLLLQDMEKNGTDFLVVDSLGRKRRMAFLDVLLQSNIDGMPLSNADIQEEVDTFTFEGHDTTNAGVGFSLFCISRNPDVQNKLFKEIREVIGDDKSKPVTMKELNDLKYLDMVLKECMRVYPPVPFIGRMLEEDLHIDNRTIPSGADLMILLFILFKDPILFPDPERFDPERFSQENSNEKLNPYAYIPFSAGPRNCIGQKYAMFEMKSVVSKVLRNFELLPLGEDPKTTLSVVLRSTNGVQLGIKPRIYA